MEARVWGRTPRVIYVEVLGLPSLVGLPCFRTDPRTGSVRGLFMLCWLGPRADVAAQAWHEACAEPARVRLILSRAVGRPIDLGPDGKLALFVPQFCFMERTKLLLNLQCSLNILAIHRVVPASTGHVSTGHRHPRRSPITCRTGRRRRRRGLVLTYVSRRRRKKQTETDN